MRLSFDSEATTSTLWVCVCVRERTKSVTQSTIAPYSTAQHCITVLLRMVCFGCCLFACVLSLACVPACMNISAYTYMLSVFFSQYEVMNLIPFVLMFEHQYNPNASLCTSCFVSRIDSKSFAVANIALTVVELLR